MAKKIQIILVIFFVLAGLRLFFIYRGRHQPATAPTKTATSNLNADDYVVPTQTHAYDLKSAKEALASKTIWVKAGYQIYFYPYVGGRVDFKHPAGLLPPLDRIQVTNVIQRSE